MLIVDDGSDRSSQAEQLQQRPNVWQERKEFRCEPCNKAEEEDMLRKALELSLRENEEMRRRKESESEMAAFPPLYVSHFGLLDLVPVAAKF